MAQRITAAVLIVLFAPLLYVALNDILRVVADGHYNEIPLLLFCVIACVGWIAFMAVLALAGTPAIRAAPAREPPPLILSRISE